MPRLQSEVGYVPPPARGAVATVEVIPTSISWTRPRRLGDVYVALRAWQYLGLDRVLQRLLGNTHTRVPMAVIAVNRLVEPRSERGIFHGLRFVPPCPNSSIIPRPRLFAVLAYALAVTIQLRHRQHGGALTSAALLEALQPLGLAELSYRTSDGTRLAFERAAVPSAAQQALLESLGWPISEHYLPPNWRPTPAV